MKDTNILIPDGECHFTLCVINSLSSHKYLHIHILSSKKWVESRFSSRIKSFSYYEKISNEIEFIDFLKDQINTKKIDVLLPVNFSMIRLISKFKSSFVMLNNNIVVSSVKNLDIANNKWELSKFLNDNNFPIPKTEHLNDIKIKNIINLEYPLLLKPLSNWNGNGILKIKSHIEFKKLLDKISLRKNHIIQEYIEGTDYCVSVLCNQGKLCAYTIQKGILPNSNQFQSHLGSEFLFNEKLHSLIKQVILKLNWSGVANFDVRYSEKQNQFYIIEINPRFWGSLEASTYVGVNFPFLMCQLSLGIPFNTPDYKYEKYISNRGTLKLLFSKFLLQKGAKLPIENNSLKYVLNDPKPKLFKYFKKSAKALTLNKINFFSFMILFSWY